MNRTDFEYLLKHTTRKTKQFEMIMELIDKDHTDLIERIDDYVDFFQECKCPRHIDNINMVNMLLEIKLLLITFTSIKAN